MAKDQSLEVWQNVTEALLGLKKIDYRGNDKDALVRAGAKVTLTPEERELNESMIVDDKFNPFKNGMLRAVKLTDDPEAGEVDTSAHLSDEEMSAFFKKTVGAYTKAVNEVTSSFLLQRLIKHGEENEATVRQVQALRDRLETVDPPLRHIDVVQVKV